MLVINRKETLTFSVVWKDLESILKDKSGRENKKPTTLLVCEILKMELNKSQKNENRLVATREMGKMVAEVRRNRQVACFEIKSSRDIIYSNHD